MKKTYCLWAFQINKTTIFEVRYSKIGGNQTADFATSAEVFNQPKNDFKRCGQCQTDVLPKHSKARNFWEKWDEKHLHDLTENEYLDLLKDIEELKTKYNFIEIREPQTHYICFNNLKKLSMERLKFTKENEK